MFTDKAITCKVCELEFVFSVSEQELFAAKKYADPCRCPECRAVKRANWGQREMFPTVCASCGKETTVPIQPHEGRPMFCRDCFRISETKRGIITALMTRSNYGFILQEDESHVYFHKVGVIKPEFDELREGMTVEFLITTTSSGNHAIGVVAV